MDKSKESMFTGRNVVGKMNKQRVFTFSACQHLQFRHTWNQMQFQGSIFGKSR